MEGPGDPLTPITTSAQTLPRSAALDATAGLVAACRSGRLDAFERLFALHGPRMKSIALNLLGNPADVEDVVQEAFLKIYRSLDRFRGQSAFSTWIYRILVNCCYDFRRRRLRRTEASEVEIEPEASGASSEESRGAQLPPVPAADHALRMALEKCVAQLSDSLRVVFLLYEVEGFAHAEIAGMLKISEGASKNRLFEAKRELRRRLSESPRAAEAGAS